MSAPQLVAGQIVAGKYAVQSVLQYGGVVATYHAIAAPHREVALKLYDASLKASFDLLGMLRRQESATNQLPDNCVNRILETGEDSEPGFVFSVTEFVTHPSLTQLVELCPLSPVDTVTLLRNLARVIDLAHSVRFAHLGLKPTNLFVGPAPGFNVRVADFGLNGMRASRLAVDPLGPWAGWIAPEQAVGAGGPAADVFSAALIAFFAMTGRSFWRSLQRGAFDPSAWEAERRRPRTPVAARSVECGLSLPQTLDAPFARALCDVPGERFASVGALADALAAALEMRPGQVPMRPGAPAVATRGALAPRGRQLAQTLIGIPGPSNPFASQTAPDTPTRVRAASRPKSGAPLQALSATTFSAPAQPPPPVLSPQPTQPQSPAPTAVSPQRPVAAAAPPAPRPGPPPAASPGVAPPFVPGSPQIGQSSGPGLRPQAQGRSPNIAFAYGLNEPSLGATVALGSQQDALGSLAPRFAPNPPEPQQPTPALPPQQPLPDPRVGPSPLAHMVAEAASAAAGMTEGSAAKPLVSSPPIEPLLSAVSEAPAQSARRRWLIAAIIASVVVIGGLALSAVLILFRRPSPATQAEAPAASSSSEGAPKPSASLVAQPELPPAAPQVASAQSPEAPTAPSAATEEAKAAAPPTPVEIAPPPPPPATVTTVAREEPTGGVGKKPAATTLAAAPKPAAATPAAAPKKPCGKFLKRCP